MIIRRCVFMSKKVTISKIKEFAKDGGNIKDLGIEVLKYNQFRLKDAMVKCIVKNSFDVNDNLDYAFNLYSRDMIIVRHYSNIDFNTIDSIEDETKQTQKAIEFYDMLKESGIINYVLSAMPDEEKAFIDTCVDKEIEFKLNKKEDKESIEDIIRNFLNELLTKIPDKEGMLDLLAVASKEFKGFDPEKLGIAKEMLMGLGQTDKAEFVGAAKENMGKVVEVVKDELKEKKAAKKNKTK
jgi:hypothetical protein